ncbi:Uncharacterised protein [Chryseobacterium nakagawai]|uniref:Uncharacterized protein n=1 Tax=Chryseobacterium nakagawai TaxID=1241982 RepID=A0AAD0YU06_CHRNA|nr:hypothetical protein EG343_21640 [Chryseobacterium nakagawai]VEH19646.1 Uncharacterised protein [Chryseobacterium nakagawai]
MDSKVRAFVESFRNKPAINFSIKDFTTRTGQISFSKLLKTHNHEVWKRCECGNEEDLRMTWHCSQCGKVLFKPNN